MSKQPERTRLEVQPLQFHLAFRQRVDEMFSNTRPGKIMNTEAPISTESLTPILYVRDFKEAMDYYTGKLLFKRLWDWGVPPTFGAVRLGQVEMFFCEGAQGHPGTWNMIFIDD